MDIRFENNSHKYLVSRAFAKTKPLRRVIEKYQTTAVAFEFNR